MAFRIYEENATPRRSGVEIASLFPQPVVGWLSLEVCLTGNLGMGVDSGGDTSAFLYALPTT